VTAVTKSSPKYFIFFMVICFNNLKYPVFYGENRHYRSFLQALDNDMTYE